MKFPRELPSDSLRTLIDAVRQGDYASPEAADAALWCLGCANAFRGPAATAAAPDGENGEIDFAKPKGPDGKSLSRASIHRLADAAEQGLGGEGTQAAAGAGAEAAAFPAWLIPVVLQLAQKFLEKWLSKQ